MHLSENDQLQGSPTSGQVAHKDHVCRPRTCSKKGNKRYQCIHMKGELSNIFISEVCIKLVALRTK